MKTIKNKLNNNLDAVSHIRNSKWNWTSHVSRLGDNRWTYKTMFWQPWGEKRRRGRNLSPLWAWELVGPTLRTVKLVLAKYTLYLCTQVTLKIILQSSYPKMKLSLVELFVLSLKLTTQCSINGSKSGLPLISPIFFSWSMYADFFALIKEPDPTWILLVPFSYQHPLVTSYDTQACSLRMHVVGGFCSSPTGSALAIAIPKTKFM